jgi:hypothetical protein
VFLRDADLRTLDLRVPAVRLELRLLDLRVLVLRGVLEGVVLRAAVRRLLAPDRLPVDRLRFVITESPCVGWVNGFLLTIFGRAVCSLTSTGTILCTCRSDPGTVRSAGATDRPARRLQPCQDVARGAVSY